MKLYAAAITVAVAALFTALPVAFHSSTILKVETAEARVGRPLTPGSVAGVHRRVYRRNVYRGAAYGAAAYGAYRYGAYNRGYGYGTGCRCY